MHDTLPQPTTTFGEELASSITHGVGTALAFVAMVVLMVAAATQGDAWHVIACSIFGITLILSYLSSTLYHALPQPGVRALFRLFDHAAIFLLIAGSYTPFTLVTLRGPWGWSLFSVIWALALLGILCEVFAAGRLALVRVAVYIVMGWTIVVATRPMLDLVAPGGLLLLLWGGIAYTAGTIFYVWRKLPYNHAIWHLFVLAGSALHFFAILKYVIPGPTAG
jgi:hemolysin III